MHSVLAAMKPWGLLSPMFIHQTSIKPQDTANLCPSPPSQLSALHKIHEYSYSKFLRDTLLPDTDRQTDRHQLVMLQLISNSLKSLLG